MEKRELEAYVLGSIISNHGKEALSVRLIADDFSIQEHKDIFLIILRRLSEGVTISFDAISVDAELSPSAQTIILTLQYGDWSEASMKDAEKAVNDLSTYSDNMFVLEMFKKGIASIEKRQTFPVDKLMSQMTGIVGVLMGRRVYGKDIGLGEAVEIALDKMNHRMSKNKLYFGLRSIDMFTNFLNRGEVVIIGARTNVGKSMLALTPAIASAKKGRKVLICLNEMDSENMSLRMLANISKTDINVITGDYSPTSVDVDAMQVGVEEMQGMNIFFRDKVKYVSMIEEALAAHKALGQPVDMVVLDHFNRLQDDSGKNRKEYEYLKEASNKISELAKTYNCTFIVMAQINRAGALADQVSLEHLKGCGALEEDADKVFLMWGDKDNPDNRILYLAKNRSGKKDEKFTLQMCGSIMTLKEVEG